LHNKKLSNKTHQPSREIYAQIPHSCPICKKLYRKSKKFSSPYALMYHLSDIHVKEDENLSGISIDEILLAIRLVCKAYKIGILWT